ncbi:hypothetical protein OXX79_011070 [Metschnikowia pulcherrima]
MCDTAEGTLVVMVCRARHLPNRRKLDKQSPYVLLRIHSVAKKTPAHFRAGQTPEWTHEIRFDLTRDRKPLMRLDVLDETKNDPTPIGGTEIDCAQVFGDENNLQPSGKFILDRWHDLQFNGRYAGKIFLEMTFYPSAPMLPPKLSSSNSIHKLLPEPPMDEVADSFRHSAPAVPTVSMGAENDVFVSSPPRKSHFFRSSDPQKHVNVDDSVFVENSAPKPSRFTKLKSKFLAKEPITGLWAHDQRQVAESGPRASTVLSDDESLLNAPSPLDNLDDLSAEIGLNMAPSGYLPQIPDSDMAPPPPPPPPPHSASASVSSEPHRPTYTPHTGRSPHRYDRSPELMSAAKSASPSPPKNRRKPPPDLAGSMPVLDTTNIPFSADNFQLDAAHDDSMPTKVYHMDTPVKSLTVMASDREKHSLNPNEIDPRFYAPTPSEHLSKSTLLQSKNRRFEDSGTYDSGYVGEGKWSLPKHAHGKFSPSVFQRIHIENEGDENKPPVPPKIPSGLSEREYFVLDKDNYLKDMNGRRF